MSDQETLYARWLSGDITPEEEIRLKNSGEWEELEAIAKATEALTLPSYDQDSAYKSLITKRTKTKTVYINVKWLIGIAASLAILVVAFFFLPSNAVEIQAPYAQNITHITPDQSTIVLNDGSTLSYNKSGWSDKRTIILTGEASFDVTEGAPFIVETDQGSVEVLGTSFNVRSWDGSIQVECYTGTVRVKSGTNKTELLKGMAVKMSDDRNYPYTIDHGQAQWQTGMSTFKSERISNVFEELGRQYDVVVSYEGDNLRFTGGFVHSGLEDALYQITGPLGLEYEIKPDGSVRVFK